MLPQTIHMPGDPVEVVQEVPGTTCAVRDAANKRVAMMSSFIVVYGLYCEMACNQTAFWVAAVA